MLFRSRFIGSPTILFGHLKNGSFLTFSKIFCTSSRNTTLTAWVLADLDCPAKSLQGRLFCGLTWNPSSPEGSPSLSLFPITDPPQSSCICQSCLSTSLKCADGHIVVAPIYLIEHFPVSIGVSLQSFSLSYGHKQ